MTSLQRDSIVLPARGLMIYNLSTNQIEVNTGTFFTPVWSRFVVGGTSTGADWSLLGNDLVDPATQFLGTRNNTPLIVKTANAERMRIDTNGFVGIGTFRPLSLFSVGPNSELRIDPSGNVSTQGGLSLTGSQASISLNGDQGTRGDVLISSGPNATPRFTKDIDSLFIRRLASQVIYSDSLRGLLFADSAWVYGPLYGKDVTMSGNLKLTGTNSQLIVGGTGGQPGQILMSGGNALPPQWTNTLDSLNIRSLRSDSLVAGGLRVTGDARLNTVSLDSLSSRQINNRGTITTDSLYASKFKINGPINADSIYVRTFKTGFVVADSLQSGKATIVNLNSTTINNTGSISTGSLNAKDSITTNKLRVTGDAIIKNVLADSIASRQIRNS